MTIWINTPFDTLPGEGGRPMRYWLLARALVAAGHEVVLWSSDFHHVTKARRLLPPVYEADGCQVRLIPTPTYQSNVGLKRVLSHSQYAWRWRRLAEAAVTGGGLNPPDLILTSLPPLGSYAIAAAMRERWGCRVVVDVQDAWPETFHRLLPRALNSWAPAVFWLAHRQARRAYCGADGLTAVAERYLQLARISGCRAPTAHFPLGCSLPSRRPPSAMRATAGLKLCYIGNLGGGYDLQTMIEGVRLLVAEGCPVSLTVAGDGPQRRRVLAAQQQGLPINPCGYLGQEALQAALAACDVGVVPMFAASWVAVPNKIMDYAAAGLAIINGLEGESQMLIDRYQAGLSYTTGNARSFAAAVRRYAEDRALLDRHGEGARRMAESEFDATSIYPRMADWLVRVTLPAEARAD